MLNPRGNATLLWNVHSDNCSAVWQSSWMAKHPSAPMQKPVSIGRRKTKYLSLKKVKCTLVQALRLCTGRTAYRRSRGIALPFHDLGTRRGWRVSVKSRPLFTPGKEPVPEYRRPGGPQGRSEQVRKTRPTRIRSPDRPTPSQSLYRLSYPTHWKK